MKTPMEWYEVAGLLLLILFFLVALITDGFDFTLYKEQKNNTKHQREMKTPIQNLIEQLKKLQETQDPYGFHDAIEFAELSLEEEKEVMCEFADKYRDVSSKQTTKEFFELTFKPKER